MGVGRSNTHALNPRNAPRIRNIFVSAVASSTAVGTLETRISRAVQACTSIWSYPAPVQLNQQMSLNELSTTTLCPPIRCTVCHTIVCNELQALGQNSKKLLIKQACDSHRLEGSIRSPNIIELSLFALLYEFLPRASFRLDDLCDFGERGPFFVGTE